MIAKEKVDRSLRFGVVDTSSSLEKYQYLPAVTQPLPPITMPRVQVNSFFHRHLCAKAQLFRDVRVLKQKIMTTAWLQGGGVRDNALK